MKTFRNRVAECGGLEKRGMHWLVLFALSLVCFLAYQNSFQNQFMLDDHIILFGQQGVLNKSLFEVFTSRQGGFYRPIGHLPLWFFSRLLGSNYIGYHVVNFFLFVLMVFFFFVIIRKITSEATLSFLSALLYAIHPLNAMIVNYITANIIAVFVLSMQISFLFFMFFSERGQKRDYIFSLVFFIFACLSHEMAVMLPAYLAAYLFFIKKESWREMLGLLSPFALLLIAWAVFRFQNFFFPHQFNNLLSVTKNIAASFSTWMDLVIWYVSNLFLPGKVILVWSSPYGQEHLLRNVIIFVGAFGLGTYAFFRWERSWKSFLLMIFVLGFFPTLLSCFGDFPVDQPMIEPHWFYFSQVGFFVLLAWFLLTMVRKNFIIGSVFGGSIILLLLIYCWNYNMQWKSQEKYSLYWLSLNTGNLTPYYGLGNSLMDKGDYLGAVNSFRSGLRHLRLANVQIAADFGHCLDMLGYDKVALSWLKGASELDSSYALTYHYLGLYFMRRGNLDEAQKAFMKSVELDPKFSSSYGYLTRAK